MIEKAKNPNNGLSNSKYRLKDRLRHSKPDPIIIQLSNLFVIKTTVITIAHRLNTLIYYDKILVLDKGEIMEYDTPLNLVKNQNSFLGKLIRKTGYNFMKDLVELAEKSAKAKKKR